MLGLAGIPLGHSFTFLDPSPAACSKEVGDLIVAPYDDEEALGELAARCDVVTYEFENVDVGAAQDLAAQVPLWPPSVSLATAQDRLDEKRAFEKAGLEVATYAPVSDPEELRAAVDRVGTPCIIKTRREGYDGKGQAHIQSPDDAEEVWDSIGRKPSLVEAIVAFDRELSVIGVRSTTGETVFYPLVENHHADGILRISVAPAPGTDSALTERAEEIAADLLDGLGHVGALAIELFQADGRFLGNEMAPRVHNSGHYSIEGATTSQFENHIRAITGSPLGSTASRGLSAMVNLIGEMPEESEVLALERAHLHVYGKEARPGRKLGHVTVTGDDACSVSSSLDELKALVPGLADADPRDL
jgi:5-(carboxyamino)imidazole ribonucleotide synthase